jgi:cation diffusion facilitator family transporter
MREQMTDRDFALSPIQHSHVFLGTGHDRNARKTWAVIWLCGAMMAAEIIGGSSFGSLALIADGLHMSTHAGALLLAALAYSYARRHAEDPRFAFGTGKFGDLAGFSSALVLAMIALLIGYEAVGRLLHPIAISFDQALPIAVVGLMVNIASAWLLGGGEYHHHGHGPGDTHDHDHAQRKEVRRIDTGDGILLLEIVENGVPPRFRVRFEGRQGAPSNDHAVTLETERPDGTHQAFTFADRGIHLESVEEIPEPHEFIACIRLAHADHDHDYKVAFSEHDHTAEARGSAAAHRDNNMRAAFVHVMADAAVSVLAILGLSAGKFLGWVFMDPVMGIIGALVIANWSYGLIRDTGAILLDMNPDRRLADDLRKTIESEGDRLADLHLWRLGPGHLGAIVSVVTGQRRGPDFYRARLGHIRSLSHLTVEVLSR